MKIVALLCFKNEKTFLKTLVTSLIGVADEIIAIDDFSDDNGAEIIKSFEPKIKVTIIESKPEWKGLPVEKSRSRLLELGRKADGTHFVCLDADEAFTANFIPNAKKIISKLQPGHKLQMQWLAMWKSLDHYRDDQSVWSNNFKDFVVCDDKKIQVDEGIIHKGRTPGPNTEENSFKLNPKYGAIFHFQFANWKSFQLKQAWYRCFERSLGKNCAAVNQIYSITKDDPSAIVKAVPQEWLWNETDMPKISYNESLSWHYDEIVKLLDKHGIENFYPLEIWHIPELQKIRENK